MIDSFFKTAKFLNFSLTEEAKEICTDFTLLNM